MNAFLDWLINHMQSLDPILRSSLAGLAILAETSLFVGLIIPGDTVVLVASTGIDNLAAFSDTVISRGDKRRRRSARKIDILD